MSDNSSGRIGEALAATWLALQGYTILHQNWRYRHLEIDLIASRQGVLHFIEVKTRRKTIFGYPEESVSAKKLENMTQAAEAYQIQFREWQRIQFDIISIILHPEKQPQIRLFEDIS